jgi:hypothetical protein
LRSTDGSGYAREEAGTGSLVPKFPSFFKFPAGPAALVCLRAGVRKCLKPKTKPLKSFHKAGMRFALSSA